MVGICCKYFPNEFCILLKVRLVLRLFDSMGLKFTLVFRPNSCFFYRGSTGVCVGDEFDRLSRLCILLPPQFEKYLTGFRNILSFPWKKFWLTPQTLF